MSILRKRLGTGLLVVGLLSSMLFVIDSVASPESADARCRGRGVPITSDYIRGGRRVAMETPNYNTCDGDNAYLSTLIDPPPDDGRLAAVHIQDGAQGWVRAAITGTRVAYRWNDVNGTSQSNMRLCASNLGCGWGTTINGYGSNYGY